MFDNLPIEIDNDIRSDHDTAGFRIPTAENYRTEQERAKLQLRENIAKLPRWRRRLIETALDGSW
jgi:hypothetical protein